MYKTSEFRGYAADPLNVISMNNSMIQQIQELFPQALKNKNIPASVYLDEAKSGGLFGSRSPMFIVRHPCPPSSFFDIGILINGTLVYFPLLGESTQNTKMNKKKYYEENGNFFSAAFTKPDELILQQEMLWQHQVIDAFHSLFIF